MKRILFVFSRESSFIAIDRAVLAERWRVTPWQQRGPVVNLPRLLREVRRSDLVFGWFASWHTFFPVLVARLLRKPVGDRDRRLRHGAACRRSATASSSGALMRRVSRWVMRHATRLVTNSNYSRAEAARDGRARPGAG